MQKREILQSLSKYVGGIMWVRLDLTATIPVMSLYMFGIDATFRVSSP